MRKPINRSIEHHRTKYRDGNELLEKAFADYWEKENEQRSGINYGNGILQDLMLKRTYDLCGYEQVEWLTNKERQIAATAIQWLGTNCGFCFLGEVLKSAGYRIDSTKHDEKRSKEREQENKKRNKEWEQENKKREYKLRLLEKKRKKEEYDAIVEGKRWDVNGKMLAILERE